MRSTSIIVVMSSYILSACAATAPLPTPAPASAEPLRPLLYPPALEKPRPAKCYPLPAIYEDTVLIPAGAFRMGSDDKDLAVLRRAVAATGTADGDKLFADQLPKHEITVAAFHIDRRETTVGEYEACVASGGCEAPKSYYDEPRCNYGSDRGPRQPMNCVSWSEAARFCTHRGKRLPTEAEWEKAARGFEGRVFAWGEAAPDCEKATWGAGKCGIDSTRPVCSRAADMSPYDLCDMSGNVREWTADDYGPAVGGRRVLRGGAWDETDPRGLGTTTRRPAPPNYSGPDAGFRCASAGGGATRV